MQRRWRVSSFRFLKGNSVYLLTENSLAKVVFFGRYLDNSRSVYIHITGENGAETIQPRGDWRLHSEVVEMIWSQYGRAEVDFFASDTSTHCPLWYSLMGGPALWDRIPWLMLGPPAFYMPFLQFRLFV